MIELETALRDRLLADADVLSVIGTRLFPMVAPEDVAAPYVTVRRVSAERETDFDGPVGWAQPRLQFDIYGRQWLVNRALGRSIRKSLTGFRGTITAGSPSAEIRIGSIRLVSDRDFYDSRTRLWRLSQDFVIDHVEE